jgi:hypothetical protein
VAIEFITQLKIKPAIILILIWNVMLGVPILLNVKTLQSISYILVPIIAAAYFLYVRSSKMRIERMYRNVTEATLPRIKSGLFFISAIFIALFVIGIVLFFYK